ncbi:Rab geranylgeranyl transferase escort protein, partial [Rasamsonia emersonii CBS 393.64]
MESLSETSWDIVISGTGLAQSLLALALSRSGKKVLHVDKNPYYGGPEAGFSLQEAEEWVDRLKKARLSIFLVLTGVVGVEPGLEPFEEASIYSRPASSDAEKKLSFSRAYTLSLSPFLIYSRSKLLPTLVSSKVYRQLEFQAVGSWWIYTSPAAEDAASQSSEDASARLHRVPSSREDIFADDSISVKAKRMLIKFLRNISQTLQEGGDDVSSEEDLDLPFSEYLTSKFQVPSELHDPLLSLSLSQSSPQQTSARFAVPRIKRHLGSVGAFGPGFGSVLTKWGGGSEIGQVGCRALAVGGGVYVLDRGIQSVELPNDSSQEETLLLKLSDGESIRSKFVVGSQWDLPAEAEGPRPANAKVARCIAIVSSPLRRLFPATAEGGHIPAGTVVVFPGKELSDGQ